MNNILVIDNEKLDITYQHSSINNENIQDFSLDELYKIYQETDIEMLFKHNTKNGLLLVFDDGHEISLHEYNFDSMPKPLFLKITNDILKKSDNEILITVNGHNISPKLMQWQITNTKILDDLLGFGYATSIHQLLEIAISDLNGYKNSCMLWGTTENKLKENPKEYLPALAYCKSLNIENYQGYLPAAGQLYILEKYYKMLWDIFRVLNGAPDMKIKKTDITLPNFWTSTEYPGDTVWLNDGNNCILQQKTELFPVIPFFKKIK